MGRFANSWTVFKQSLGVLKQDKELVVLPLLSGLASLAVFASFLFPTYVSGLFQKALQKDPSDQNAQMTMFVVYFVMYLVLAFITIFFQAALIYGANERLSGGDPTLGSALRGASSKLGKIFVWSMFAATVSMAIHMLEGAMRRGNNNFVGRILAGLLGTAWSLATFFVIPVILFEDKGTFQSLGRSGQLFKQRWGESLVGNWGVGFVIGLLSWLGIILFFGLAYASWKNGMITAAILLGAVGLLWIITMAILSQTLGGIYKVALYRFADKGQVVPYFQPQSIEGAYRPTYTTPDRL